MKGKIKTMTEYCIKDCFYPISWQKLKIECLKRENTTFQLTLYRFHLHKEAKWG